MRTTGSPLSLIIILVMVAFTASITMQVLWQGEDGEGWKQTIRSDARGYYGYLTAIFIRNDLGNEPFTGEFIHRTPTGSLNKYFCGTAIMMAPWFGIGHDLALGDPKASKDGFSKYEMKAIAVGGWVYLLIGLLSLRSIFLLLGVRDEVIAWLVVTLIGATTLLQYAAVQPGWSHIYSFCAISVLLLLILRVSRGASAWWLIAAAAVFGLIILIRPVNALVFIGIPVMLGKDTWPFFKKVILQWNILLLSVIAFLLVVSIQPMLWHMQTGHWFEWGYRNEGFYWTRPEVVEVLVGFRRGLFIWTPVLLLAVIAIVVLWGRDRTGSIWATLYWIANVYVISCWWIWYYGSGFGSRVFIDHYPVLIMPMALMFQRAPASAWFAIRAIIIICIGLHLIQFTQYHMGILHHERMDRAKYAYAFLRLDRDHAWKLGGKIEVPPYGPNGYDLVLESESNLETAHEYWREGRIVEHADAFSGNNVCLYDDQNEFGITFIPPPGKIPAGRELWLEVSFMRYEPRPGSSLPAYGVVSTHRPDGSFAFYDTFKMNHLPGQKARDWERIEYKIPVPAMTGDEELRFYLWNKDRQGEFMLDDMFIRVWATRPYGKFAPK